MDTTIDTLREILLPVLGFDTIDEIKPENSLITDLGADSLDFVELVYSIEQKFGVALETKEIITGGKILAEEDMFNQGKLTAKGAEVISVGLIQSGSAVVEGMSKIDIFQLITVADLAHIIDTRKEEKA